MRCARVAIDLAIVLGIVLVRMVVTVVSSFWYMLVCAIDGFMERFSSYFKHYVLSVVSPFFE